MGSALNRFQSGKTGTSLSHKLHNPICNRDFIKLKMLKENMYNAVIKALE